MLSYQQFKQKVLAFCFTDLEKQYVTGHLRRLYLTYKICRQYVHTGDKILSIGAGIAVIEKLLYEEGYDMTIIDFPEGLQENRIYDYAIKAIPLEVVREKMPASTYGLYDVVLFCEIIEHLPVAPSVILTKVSDCLTPGGYLLVTTPNLRRVSNVWRLLRGKPLLDIPEKTFGAVNAENQGIHRREYTMKELVTGLQLAGFTPVARRYFGRLRSGLLTVGKLGA